MAASQSIVIVGAGVFGLTTALELRPRGRRATVIDHRPVLTPATKDISNILRMD